MKHIPLLLLTTSLVTLAGDTNTATSAVHGLGRYRLLNAKVDQLGRAGLTTHNTVFKIDSVTGRTWRYDYISGTPVNEGFFEVRDHDLRPSAEDFLNHTNK